MQPKQWRSPRRIWWEGNNEVMRRRDLLGLLSSLALADDNQWLPEAGTLTDVTGLKVGHHTLKQRPTGCTVVLCEEGATAGVDVRGSAPGTRETDLLNPVNTVQQVHAVVLSGGSAFGLDTASGVVRYLEGKGKGYKTAHAVVPIVPAAILYDLGVGDAKIRPGAEAGLQACLNASTKPVEQGNVGAGAGATVGKMFGPAFAMKAGIGSASIRVGNTGVVVAALVAVNAVGDIVNPQTGRILAGARKADGTGFRDTAAEIVKGHAVVAAAADSGSNTTIGVVATNAALDKVQASKVAQMAHDGLARAIRPVHTPADGDTVFALATGTLKGVRVHHGQIGVLAAEAMAQAIVRAALHASTVLNFPGLKR
jgi:L-aminopeptidase/D-esterase-like protein